MASAKLASASAFVGCLLAGFGPGGCKPAVPEAKPSQVPTPAERSPAPDPPPTAAHLRAPSEQDFILEDEPPADPAELLREMRHNCCDEMPASELEAATRDAGTGEPPRAKPSATRSRRQR